MFKASSNNVSLMSALIYQTLCYYRKLADGSTAINYRNIKQRRAEILEELTGGSKEQYKAYVLMGMVKTIEDEDGFLYTTHDGETILCVGAIDDPTYRANFNSGTFIESLNMLCIADSLADGALSPTFNSNGDLTSGFMLNSIKLPFCKNIGKSAFKNQEVLAISGVVAKHTPQKEIFDAMHLVDITQKVLLTIQEASELFGLSTKSLYDFARQHPNSHTLIHNGNRVKIKRVKFQKMIEEESEWIYGI